MSIARLIQRLMGILQGTDLVGIIGVICMKRIRLMKIIITSQQILLQHYTIRKTIMIRIMRMMDMNK